MKFLNSLNCLLLLFFIGSSAWAAKLEDVKILSVEPAKDHFQLKLQPSVGPKDSYFIVDIMKDDPDAFEKLGYVFKKVMNKDHYKLDLKIPNFSASPSGSHYHSEGLDFKGSAK